MLPGADRFVGSLLGQCLGDALGFVVEGEAPPLCSAYAQEVVLARRVPTRRRSEFAFGQYSDDSQMARELMQSLVARGRFDPVDYAGRIAALFGEGRIVGQGRTTSAAAERLLAGIPWDEAGTPPPAAGNGSAMRAAPIGLFFAGRPAAMVGAARDQGRITHADPRCSAGAIAIAGAAAFAAAQDRIEPAGFLAALRRMTIEIEPTVASNLRQLEAWITLPESEAAQMIARAGLPPGVDSHWRGGISAFVVGSVLWALYAFLRSPEDYVKTIATAIFPGGDVDTTAAMAGAISGAHLGTSAIPEDLTRHLNDRGSWGCVELTALARRCHAAAARRDSGA